MPAHLFLFTSSDLEKQDGRAPIIVQRILLSYDTRVNIFVWHGRDRGKKEEAGAAMECQRLYREYSASGMTFNTACFQNRESQRFESIFRDTGMIIHHGHMRCLSFVHENLRSTATDSVK